MENVTMKKLTTLLIAALLGTGAFAVAASPDDYRDQRHEERVEKRIDHMTEQLNLSAEQQKQIRALYEKHREERKAMRDAKKKDLEAILTKEQREKWQKHREDRKRCKRGKKGKGGYERHDDEHRDRYKERES